MNGYLAAILTISIFVTLGLQVKRDMSEMIKFADACLATGGVTVVEYTRPQTPVCVPMHVFKEYKYERK